MLTPDTETPEVTETTVSTNLLQPLQVVTELRVDTVGQDLRVLAIDDVPLPVQEPRGDLELRGVLDDGDNTLELIGVQLASAGITVLREPKRTRRTADSAHTAC